MKEAKAMDTYSSSSPPACNRAMSKTVAMLGSMPPLRGLSGYCLELASAVADSCSVEFISFKRIYPSALYPGGELADDLTYPKVSCTDLVVRRRLTWYNPIGWFTEGLFSKGDLLHAQWWSPPLVFIYMVVCLGFRLRGKPVVLTLHNIVPHEGFPFFERFARILLRICSHFIVHSSQNKSRLIDLYRIPSSKVTVIPHGPLDFFAGNELEKEKMKRELGFRPENKVILLFGAIRPYKGVDTAIQALEKIVGKIPEARLLIAGKLWESWAPYKDLLERLKLEDFTTVRLGYVPSGEVGRLFAAADLAILPYRRFDAQSGVGAAAIAFRRPLIVTDVGGLPELVLDRRFVVPPKDPESLASTVISCLEDPFLLSKMAADAAVVAQKTAWSGVAKKTRAVYRDVLHVDLGTPSRDFSCAS